MFPTASDHCSPRYTHLLTSSPQPGYLVFLFVYSAHLFFDYSSFVQSFNLFTLSLYRVTFRSFGPFYPIFKYLFNNLHVYDKLRNSIITQLSILNRCFLFSRGRFSGISLFSIFSRVLCQLHCPQNFSRKQII